ncbi:MAG TPA: hypothetical protein VF883_09825 [Thermoanaerobaculia bacterium]|jgi:hypothetical protein
MTRALISALVLTLIAAGCREAEQPPAAPASPATPPVAESSTVAPTATQPQPAEVPPEPLPEHDVTGSYFAMDKLPADFAELDHLMLATIDENAEPAPLNGFLRPKKQSAEDYKLVNPTMTGRTLTFTTAPVNGTHYEFTGAFDVLHKFAENPPPYETAVLTGTLTKHRGGNSIATTPVKFRYENGG